MTPWTAAYQAPPSMGFSRQKYWSGVPLPSPSEPLGQPLYNLKMSIVPHTKTNQMILLSSVEIEVKIWIHIYEILPIDFLVKLDIK